MTGLLHRPIFVRSRGLRAEKYGHNSLIPRLIANLRQMFSHAKLRHATLFLSIFKKPKELSWRKHLALFLVLELRITLETFQNIRHLKYLSPNCLFLSDFRIWTDIFAWQYYLTFLGWNLFITVTLLKPSFRYFVFEWRVKSSAIFSSSALPKQLIHRVAVFARRQCVFLLVYSRLTSSWNKSKVVQR